MTNSLEIGNVGVITTVGQTLYEVTGIRNGLVYCLPMTGAKTLRVCLPNQFWVLIDHMP